MIFFDVTVTFRNGLNTGIQRVVRKLAQESKAIDFQLVASKPDTKNNFIPVTKDQLNNFYNYPTNWAHTAISEILVFLRNFRFIIVIANIHPRFIELKERLQQKISPNYARFTTLKNLDAIEISKNDVYFTADAFWNTESDYERLRFAADSGANVIVLVHDILPLTNPELFEKNNILNFRKFFPKGVEIAQKLIFTSESVKKDFYNYFSEIETPCAVVGLGSNAFKNFKNDALHEEKDRILILGTLEPRKNYIQVLKWYEDFKPDLPLYIVGRKGWHSSRIVFQIKKLQFLRRNVVWLRNASDTDVKNLISKVKVAICPSIAEGFGLPLRELISMNIPVVASNIPVYNEVNSELIRYFELGNNDSLNKAFVEAINISKDFRINSEVAKLQSWRETYIQIVNFIYS